VPALRGVSLAVQEGEFRRRHGGRLVAEKSTMLHLMGGLLTPTKGRILIDGEDLTAPRMQNERHPAAKDSDLSFSASICFPR